MNVVWKYKEYYGIGILVLGLTLSIFEGKPGLVDRGVRLEPDRHIVGTG